MFTVKDMLEAGVHFGHCTSGWHPKMAPYIFGIRQKLHIIDLNKAKEKFIGALDFISGVAEKNGRILFVGTKKTAQSVIREEAVRAGMPYVDYRWLGGMLTNYKTIRQSIKHLRELEALRDSPKFADFTKKEALEISREIEKLEKNLGGIKNMAGLPDVLFVVDIGHEKTAISEAKKLGIPVVAIVDTNYNPEEINYVIPGNDDAIRSIKFFASNVAEAIITARANIVHEEVHEENKNVNKKRVAKPRRFNNEKRNVKVVRVVKKDNAVAAKEEA